MKVPREALRLDLQDVEYVEFNEATADGSSANRRSFAGQVNSGESFTHWLWGQAVVDLESLRIERQDLPVLRDHYAPVGYTESVEVTDAGLQASGTLLSVTEAGRETLALMSEGFPMQMSCELVPQRLDMLNVGESVEVNGREFAGPGAVMRGCHLREVTVVPLGADERTNATLLAGGTGGASSTGLEIEVRQMTRNETPEPEAVPDLTAERLQAAHAEVYGEVFAAGQAAERERVAFLHERAAAASPELLAQAVAEGWDRERALDEFLRYATERREARLELIREEQSEDTSVETFTEEETDTETEEADAATVEAMPEIVIDEDGEEVPNVEKFAAEWRLGLDRCREEFTGPDAKEAYLAFRRHTPKTA